MKFLSRLAVSFYIVTILFVCSFLLLFALNLIPIDELIYFISTIETNYQVKSVFGLIGLLLLWINFICARVISGEHQKEKTIAFDNPSGRVSVSLTAMEDLVKRLVVRLPEIREVKPVIVASKRGILIEARLVLRTETNLPNMTLKLQELIKGKIQDIVGIEEQITVKVHVTKIILEENKEKRQKEKSKSEDKTEPNIPFRGYRA